MGCKSEWRMEMENKDTNIKVPLLSKVAYGMGDVGCNFSWMFVGNFLMIFYTDVFGISMSAVATLMLFSRFWDAIMEEMRMPFIILLMWREIRLCSVHIHSALLFPPLLEQPAFRLCFGLPIIRGVPLPFLPC